jgi:fucose 4-O-acetylase-like acetyltransferase
LRFAVAGAVAIAVLSPVVANLDWSSTPNLVREYLASRRDSAHGSFAFFPCAAYLGFGLAAGAVVRRAAAERMERMMQWSALIGITLVFVSQYFSNLPYSVYAKSNFWLDNPTLVLIRTGISLILLAGSYLWTEFAAGPGWSWVECLGKNSLMVYWVHVMLVYGSWVSPIKRTLAPTMAALATVVVILMMVALSVLWLQWKARRSLRVAALSQTAGNSQSSKGRTVLWPSRRKLG